MTAQTQPAQTPETDALKQDHKSEHDELHRRFLAERREYLPREAL